MHSYPIYTTTFRENHRISMRIDLEVLNSVDHIITQVLVTVRDRARQSETERVPAAALIIS